MSENPAERSEETLATRWSRLAAGDYEYLARRYWKPVRRFLRERMHDAQEAEDLTQELFLGFLERDLLARVDPGRGSFRSFLFHVARQFLIDRRRRDAAAKRGAGRNVSLDPSRDEPVDPLEAPEEAFDREWYQSLFHRARRELKARSATNPDAYRAFRAYFLGESTGHPVTYADVAERLGLTEAQVRNHLHRTRKLFGDLVMAAVAEYTASESEAREEMARMVRFLEGRLEPGRPDSGVFQTD